MIEDNDIFNTLTEQLEYLDIDPPLPVGWPNKDVAPGTPLPYLIVTHVPVSRTDDTLNGGGEIARGFIVITVMSEIGLFTTARLVKNGKGVLVPSVGVIAGKIKALFPYPLRLPVTGGAITVSQPPQVQQGYPDGPHWRVPVKINYSAS